MAYYEGYLEGYQEGNLLARKEVAEKMLTFGFDKQFVFEMTDYKL